MNPASTSGDIRFGFHSLPHLIKCQNVRHCYRVYYSSIFYVSEPAIQTIQFRVFYSRRKFGPSDTIQVSYVAQW